MDSKIRRIAVISLGFGQSATYLARTRRNKLSYCKARGYTCILSARQLENLCSHELASHVHLIHPASWMKMPILSACLNFFERVAWLDSDALFLNLSPLDVAIGSCASSAFVISGNDCDPYPFTNGGFLYASRDALVIIEAVLHASRSEQARNHMWWEQQAINELISTNDTLARFICVTRHDLQMFPTATCMPRRNNNFIAHWAGGKDYPRVANEISLFQRGLNFTSIGAPALTSSDDHDPLFPTKLN